MIKKFLKVIFLLTSLLQISACEDESQIESFLAHAENFGSNQDNWVVQGIIANKEFSAGEIFALGVDGIKYRSKIGKDLSFGIELPGNTTYALYFFKSPTIKNDNVISASEFISSMYSGQIISKEAPVQFVFASSLNQKQLSRVFRLPHPGIKPLVNLGEIQVGNDFAQAQNNPAKFLDFDKDGFNDFIDPDDQNDGVLDEFQTFPYENVIVCHYESQKTPVSKQIHLQDLFWHYQHEDTFGPCNETEISLHSQGK